MISFISNSIDKPWTDEDVHYYENKGSQRDIIQYNSYYNWRVKLTDKNTFLCSIKTNNNGYKNIYLFAVTRSLFYFVIFVPQLEILKALRVNRHIKHFISLLSLTNKCLESENNEIGIRQDVLFLDGSCLLVKVNAPIDSFLFPRNKNISNVEIKKKYALLNNLYFQIEKEYESLCEIIGKYNSEIERILYEQKEKLKRILVRKVVRTGISIALAGITGGLSIGLDALFDLGDVAEIHDVIDHADISSMMVDAVDAIDVSNILNPDILDFNVDNMVDINIYDIGEGDDLLAEGYNVSFRSNQASSNIDSIYNPHIERSYQQLESDVERISNGNIYTWENPDNTIKSDNESIKYWERAKSEALSKEEIHQSKQDYWNSISDFCKERMGRKIHGA